MRRHYSQLLFATRWVGIPASVLLVVFASIYLFGTPAQTGDSKASVENSLVLGKLAFTHLFVQSFQNGSIVVANPDGTNGSALPLSSFAFIVSQPAWSPDGTKIVFTENMTLELAVSNADGSSPVKITNTSSTFTEYNPSWGAHGKIAYERQDFSQPGSPTQIWTINPDGTGAAQFTGITRPSPTGPAWSPDGSKLAFSSGGDIWVINADGSNQIQLTTQATVDVDPAWSPGGTKIVFGRGTSGLATIDANGTNLTPLTANNDGLPSWSHDGTKIAFAGSGGVYTMDANGGNVALIAASTCEPFPGACNIRSNPAWQPVQQPPTGGRSIGGRVTHNGLGVPGVTINLSGTTNATTTTDAVGNYVLPGIALGGNYYVSASRHRYYFTPPNRVLTNVTASQMGVNFDVLGICFFGQCRRNGRIGFVRSTDIFLINPDGSGEVNITNTGTGEFEVEFGGDGSVLLTGNADGDIDIYRKSAVDAPPVNLTNNTAEDTGPAYSLDGKLIAFATNRDGNTEIYKMNADGSNPIRLTNNTDTDTNPALSPDGQKIIFLKQATAGPINRAMWIMNADGSDQHVLFQGTGPSPGFGSPSYSPDGTKIMFGYTQDTSNSVPSTWTMNADGTNAVIFPAGATQGAYSPDGEKVVYICCPVDFNGFINRLRSSTSTGGSQTVISHNTQHSAPAWQPIAAPRPTAFDYDGDSRADISFFRPVGGFWWQARSTGPIVAPQWGLPDDVLTPADYDGDMKTDIAVWRESDATFYALNSFDLTVRIEQFGIAGDIPTGGDFDGDGKADIAVYRAGAQSFFYYRASMGNPQKNITFVPWGTTGDKPVVGDFDGDGRTDVGVFRPSANTWYVRKSADAGLLAAYFGAATDQLVPADYDRDGKTDIAVFRSGNGVWYLLRSGLGFTAVQWGMDKDIPAPADYDGDGKADLTIFRQGTWWILKSETGTAEGHPFGGAGDKPIPAAYVR